ncbi:hypothetical protein BDN72DRAFT_832871 [Pluteus cervinus]|uniref:Uncharacterized protein n=1 Tax=Pluteus cervinus TaxID=181527 RepID=A0ACD3B9E7_9AGAR|nr:hypothetical protein BDN72DRAFT_832871 [Pluteus cervinus]
MSNQRSFNEEQFRKDIMEGMRKVTIGDPSVNIQDAFIQVAENMMKDNPWVPPEGTKCPIHDLPNEILAYIFGLGIQIEEEEEEEDGEDGEDGDYEPGEDEEDEEGEDADDDDDEKDRQKKKKSGGGVGDGERGGYRTGPSSSSKTTDQAPTRSKPQRFLVAGTEVQVIKTNFNLKDVTPYWRDFPIFRGTPIKDEEEEKNEGEKEPKPEGGDGGEDGGGGKEEDDEDDEPVLPFQVLVSHVCRRWRDISLNTPLFWNKLNFTEGLPFEKSRVWIERARDMPLDLEIDCTVDDDEDEDDDEEEVEEKQDDDEDPELEPAINKEALAAILNLVIPYISQWRSLRFMVSYYEYMHMLLARLSRCPPAPQLEVLKLCHYEDCEEYDAFEPCDFVTPFQIFGGSAPNLKELGLWGVHLDWELSLGFFSNLVDLELAYHAKDVRPSFTTFAAMLLASPHLETLKLGLSGPAGGVEDWGEDVIEAPSVAELVLNYHECKYIQELMAHLITPNVQRLGLAYDAEDYSEFGRQLAKPMPGKPQSLLAGLRQLKISGLPCDTKTIEGIFDQLTGLELLNLNCSSQEGDAFFCVLSRPKSPPSTSNASSSNGDGTAPSTHTRSTSTAGILVYCPRLHTLTTTGITGAQMKSFVEFRKKAGVPLKAVFMGQDDEVSDKEEAWLMNNLESLQYFMPSDDEEVIDDDDVEEWATDDDAE